MQTRIGAEIVKLDGTAEFCLRSPSYNYLLSLFGEILFSAIFVDKGRGSRQGPIPVRQIEKVVVNEFPVTDQRAIHPIGENSSMIVFPLLDSAIVRLTIRQTIRRCHERRQNNRTPYRNVAACHISEFTD
jgi:hypothetical protein